MKLVYFSLKFVALAAVLSTVSVSVRAQVNSEPLWTNVFALVSSTGVDLVLRFPTNGERFVYCINNGPLTKSEYGSEIHLPIGATMRLVGKHTQLYISDLPRTIRTHGFRLKRVYDQRSVGGQQTEAEAFAIIKTVKSSERAVNSYTVTLVEPSVDAVSKLLNE